jgi:hypothetical protein
LNADVTSMILPSTRYAGMLHFIASSASGRAAWTRSRTFSRIDRANGCAFAM